jgi:two-component system cell cycle sensor histidine kinase/response regulator CckA
MGPSPLARLHSAAAVQASDDAIFARTLDGIVQSWNPAAERIFGYTAQEMLGSPLLRLVPPELRAEEHDVLARIRAGARAVRHETVRVHKDGHRIVVARTVAPICDDGGELVGLTTIVRDIATQRGLEEQLRQTRKMEAIGLLTGGVAHDLNNILTIIEGFATFLGRSIAPASREYPDLLGIRQATERAAGLTQQLLAFSRPQAAQLEVLDLSGLVRETTGLLARLLGEHIRLQLQVAAEPAFVHGDRGELSQVLINLAVNARDAMPTGGTLSVSTYVDTAARRAVLTVRDTGHGMDASTRERLFEPFFTTKPAGEGTGLGLATVHGIVSRLGGRIEVDSAPGEGAVFRVVLPTTETSPAQPRVEEPGELRGREAVLVVDDEPQIAELAARTLLRYGYTVVEASGPGAAMVAFAEQTGRIDLLLTDVVMPGMNGPALAGRLRLQDPDLAVLYMSGYTDHPSAGAGGHDAPLLAKPFTPPQLAGAVRALLDRRRAERSGTAS